MRFWRTGAVTLTTLVVSAAVLGGHQRFGAAEAAAPASPSPTSSSTHFPDSMRIPVDMYAAIAGVRITPADPTQQPPGAVVSQAAAENAATSFPLAGPGSTIIGTGLANVSGLGGTNPAGLYWIVSVDPPGGVHSNNGTAQNFFNIFINAATGKYAAGFSSGDPAYPPLPNNQTPGTPSTSAGN
jgi:hypothetical protein